MGDLADRIRIAAERVGGLKDLAEAIEVPRRTLGNWLSGRSPKPDALRRIASVTEVSLDWLLTGEGEPTDNGLDILSRKLDRQRENQMSQDEFEEGLRRGLDLINGNLRREVVPSPIDVRREVMRAVRDAYRASNVVAAGDDIALVAMDIYAKLKGRVRSIDDLDEVSIVLTHLMHNLQQDLREAARKPGSGKREASSL